MFPIKTPAKMAAAKDVVIKTGLNILISGEMVLKRVSSAFPILSIILAER